MGMIKWGIVAPGGIATKFATALVQTNGALLTSICSRSMDKASGFAEQFNPAAACFDDLNRFLAEADVDVVYVANPHPFHFDTAMRLLEAGKNVLCEKPMTMNAVDTATLIAKARERYVFLMEAIWMRCMPALLDAKRRIEAGEIGEVIFLQTQLTLGRAFQADHRLFAPELGGGSLLDLGIYPLAFADMFLGKPNRTEGVAHMAPTGVDDTLAFNTKYDSGAIAQLLCSSRVEVPNTALITGTKGSIQFDPWMHEAQGYNLKMLGQEKGEHFAFPHQVNGYEYEIQEVHRALAAGEKETPLLPLDTSLRLAKQMDQLLASMT